LGRICRGQAVSVANFSAHRRGSLIAPETQGLFFNDLADAVQTAEVLNCRTLMVLSNELGQAGQVVDPYDHIPDDKKFCNLLEGLTRALENTPEWLTLVIEPLNTRLDHPGCFLSDMATAVSIVRRLGHPRLKVLADLYHLGMMGEDLQALIAEYTGDIGYVHIADIPGRQEPGTGTADWPGIFAQLRHSGYTGSVGFEYQPAGDTEASLEAIARLWEKVI
jgi:hydroxypyruvate isomerase